MSMPTPDVELDLMTHAATMTATNGVVIAGATRNAWGGPQRPADATTLAVRHFFQAFGGEVVLHNDGRVRRFDIQVLTVGARDAYEAARAAAWAVHDTLALVGRFEVNTHTFIDCRAVEAAPMYVGVDDSDAHLFVSNFSLWYDG
jgi:hypothetical protein